MDRTLTDKSYRQWGDASVFWSGVVKAGKHIAWMQSPNAHTWGCHNQREWGDLDIAVIPATSGVVAYLWYPLFVFVRHTRIAHYQTT